MNDLFNIGKNLLICMRMFLFIMEVSGRKSEDGSPKLKLPSSDFGLPAFGYTIQLTLIYFRSGWYTFF